MAKNERIGLSCMILCIDLFLLIEDQQIEMRINTSLFTTEGFIYHPVWESVQDGSANFHTTEHHHQWLLAPHPLG